MVAQSRTPRRTPGSMPTLAAEGGPADLGAWVGAEVKIGVSVMFVVDAEAMFIPFVDPGDNDERELLKAARNAEILAEAEDD